MKQITRRQIVTSGVVAGAGVLISNQVTEAAQPDNRRDLSAYPICVDASGMAADIDDTSSRVGNRVIDFHFSAGGGADWTQVGPETVVKPAKARFATISLAGWQLRCNRGGGLHDMNWHDGGIIVWMHNLTQASCRALLRDDNGNEPFNGFARAMINYFG